MTSKLTILILGGYGTFGGRLAQLLKDEPRLTLQIAGRSLEKARSFCDLLGGSARAMPLYFDRNGDIEAQLRVAAPDIVVDASGPFQNYDNGYAVVRAALALGIDYMDLADGSEFVKGITVFDAQAIGRGIFVLSGVSSFPVLTAAVVRRLAHGMQRVINISGGIAPSPYAGVGLNVVRAIASYGGLPVATCRGGEPGSEYALISSRHFTIAPPGRVPLPPIRFSLVDVPDIKVLPDLWPELHSVWMGAGPVPAILHRALSALALLVRVGVISSLSPFAPLMHRTINVLRWGEHRGGMFVSVEGVGRKGQPTACSWHLLAEGDHGPFIPSMAAEAIVRRCIDERRPANGARPATTDLELEDYELLFAKRTIFSGIRTDGVPNGHEPVYRRVLGSAWEKLPQPVQAMHEFSGQRIAEGRATVERGPHLIARWIAGLFRLPPNAIDIPVRVTFERRGRRELWRRDFGGRAFSTTQEDGRGRFERLLCERFGPFSFGLALVVDGDRLRFVVRRWSIFGMPMPGFLVPRGESFESVSDGRFHFNVEIRLQFVGRLVHYRGWLIPRPDTIEYRQKHNS